LTHYRAPSARVWHIDATARAHVERRAEAHRQAKDNPNRADAILPPFADLHGLAPMLIRAASIFRSSLPTAPGTLWGRIRSRGITAA
jgi:hypothetical protein